MTEISGSIQSLLQLYVISILLTVALEQLFDNQAYEWLVGKGINGKPSKLLPNAELRPYIATAFGVAIALAAHLEALSAVLQIDMTSGSTGSWGPILDRVLTGVMLGGGAKTVKKLAKGIAGARSEMTSTDSTPEEPTSSPKE